MSTLETKKIEPLSGTTVTLGAAGDAVTVPSGATLKTNTVKDAGGNTLWTSDGSGTLSSVNSALPGNMIFISGQTASASSSISFTTGIDSTYDEYIFYYVNCTGSANNASFTFNGSIDAGTNYNVTKTTSKFTIQQTEAGSGINLFTDSSRDLHQSTAFQILNYKVDGNPGTGAGDTAASGEFHLFTPSNTTYVKHFYSTSQYVYYDVTSPYHTNDYNAGYLNTTSAVNAIRFQMDSGTLYGSIYMYGIKS